MNEELPPDLAESLAAVDETEAAVEATDAPAEIGADLPDDEQETESSSSLWEWASSVPDGSHRDWDPTDLWDPEGGGRARLAYHLADAAGSDGDGLPNGLGVVLSLVEIYVTIARRHPSDGDRGDGGGGEDRGEVVTPETAGEYV
jgi:hypothetical protein